MKGISKVLRDIASLFIATVFVSFGKQEQHSDRTKNGFSSLQYAYLSLVHHVFLNEHDPTSRSIFSTVHTAIRTILIINRVEMKHVHPHNVLKERLLRNEKNSLFKKEYKHTLSRSIVKIIMLKLGVQ